nr:sugar ABC transporter substrate-binding protein [Flexivirga meconopsidis]
MWGGGSADLAVWQQVINQVRTSTGTTLELRMAPFANYFTKVGTQMSADNAACIVSMQSLRIGAFTPGLLPLDDLIAKTGFDIGAFDKSVQQGLTADGKTYAIAYDVGPLVMLYNKDRFAAAGVAEPKAGWTMDDFTSAARKLTAGGKYGFVAAPGDVYMLPMIYSKTGGLPAKDGQLQLTTPAMKRGFAWYSDLVRKEKVAPPLAGVDLAFATAEFINGNAAMAVDGPWDVLSVRDQAKFKVGMAPIPAGPNGSRTLSAGSGFGISKNCTDPEKAFRAIAAMTSTETLTYLAKQGRALPARTAAQSAWFDNVKIDGAEQTIRAASATATPLRTTADWANVSNLLYQFGVGAFNGSSSPQQVLQDVQAAGDR